MQWDDAVLLGEKEITKGIVNPIHMWSHRKEGRAYELFRCAYLGEVHADH